MGNNKFFLQPEEFGRALIPKRFRSKLRKYLLKAGYESVPYSIYGWLFYFSVIITAFMLIYFFFPTIKTFSPASQLVLIFIFWSIVQLILLVLGISIIYIFYDLTITKRTRDMENIIEDFLRSVSENLKGGMSFENALINSIDPKFGVLGDEIKLIAKKIMTGQDIEDALTEFTNKYNSNMLRRSFQLIIEGLKGGGRITDIIDRTEETIRESKELKNEMIATNKTYTIFLNFIIMVITPTLFALSYTLVGILKSLAKKMNLAGGVSSGGFSLDLSALANNNLIQQRFELFSYGSLIIIAFSTVAINSIITKGDIKEGLKYIPINITISLLAYKLMQGMFHIFFGNML